ncbi:hypothetical protein GBA52_027647 [Prunus armeniaca]|nr:hypothetical protein GBA52_027647 [Prunus armeniaca]
MAVAQISASLSLSIRDASGISSAAASPARLPLFNSPRIGTAFATGSPLIIRTVYHQRKAVCKSMPLSVRCEQSTKEGGLDVWLGRLAMVGFAVAISVEVVTGKGLLESELSNVTLLVLANKQDLPNAMCASEIADKLALYTCSVYVTGTSNALLPPLDKDSMKVLIGYLIILSLTRHDV